MTAEGQSGRIPGNALVTGARGFLGHHLVSRLADDGVKVSALSRSGQDVPQEWTGRVTSCVGDLRSSESLVSAFAGHDLVFNLAGVLDDSPQQHEVNAVGAERVAHACVSAGVRRLVHVSSVGVMGPQPPGPADERAECRPANDYERTKLEGERRVRDVARQTGLEVVILRPTIVFGEGTRNRVDSLLQWLRAIETGVFAYIGKGAVANYVHACDVAHACALAATRPDAAGRTYIVEDSCPLADFVSAAADALGVRRPSLRIPRVVAFGGALFLEAISGVTRRPAVLTRKRVRALSNRTWYRGDLIREELSFAAPVGYRRGLRRTVAWYRAQDLLLIR